MPLQEKKVFINDPATATTERQKNTHLASKLAMAPNVTRKIVKIERIEIGASGWWIYYRTGSA